MIALTKLQRSGMALLASSLVLLPAAPARAEDKASQCAADSEEGQTLRDKNQYRAARSKFRSCAQNVCPGVVRKDCSKWLAELEDAMPSLVVAAVDDRGLDLADVELKMDGEVLASRLDGTPIAVDPGPHDLIATAEGREPVSLPLVVRVGDKNRLIRITLARSGSAPAAAAGSDPAAAAKAAVGEPGRPSHGPPLPSLVLGGVGAAALASWAIFGLTAQGDFNEQKDRCGPNCPDGSLDGIKTRMLIADLSLGVGIAALGTAAVLWIIHQPEPAKSVSRVPGGLRLGAHPLRGGGAAASLGGSF